MFRFFLDYGLLAAMLERSSSPAPPPVTTVLGWEIHCEHPGSSPPHSLVHSQTSYYAGTMWRCMLGVVKAEDNIGSDLCYSIIFVGHYNEL